MATKTCKCATASVLRSSAGGGTVDNVPSTASEYRSSGTRYVVFFVLLPILIAADWPQFLGPNRDSTSTEKGIAAAWPKSGPPLAWSADVGTGFSGPVVVGDKLLIFHRVDDEEVVECLNANTGKRIWKFTNPTEYRDDFGFDNGPRATPTIADGFVYTLGADGMLVCLDLAGGKRVWSRNVNLDYNVRKGYFGVGGSPLVEGDLVLVNVGGAEAGIVAFDRKTGKEVWKATNHAASYASPVSATIDGVRHALFFTREGIVSLDPTNGKVRFNKRWRARIDASVNAATPVVAGDLALFSTCYDVGGIALKVRKDGFDEVWTNDESLSCHYNTPVHHNGYVFGIHGRQEYGVSLRCIELKTGKVQWSQAKFGCTALLAIDGQILGLSESGELVLFEATPQAYREKARAKVLENKPCRAHPAFANGKLYARDGKKLGCWELVK